jgi:hypothetical protein
MAKDYARGGATRIEPWDGTWTSGYLIAGADGTVVGKASHDSGADRTVTVKAGAMHPVIWASITSAPAGSVIIW